MMLILKHLSQPLRASVTAHSASYVVIHCPYLALAAGCLQTDDDLTASCKDFCTNSTAAAAAQAAINHRLDVCLP